MEFWPKQSTPSRASLWLWISTYLVVLLYTVAFSSLILKHKALPYFDQAGYIAKVYRISDKVMHAESFLTLVNPNTYLSVKPRQLPALMPFLAAVILGGRAHPPSIALFWLGLRICALVLALHLLARLVNSSRFVLPAALVILGGLPALWLETGMYMMDQNFAFFGLLTFALLLWDLRLHIPLTAAMSVLSTLILCLIKPMALSFVFPLYCIVGVTGLHTFRRLLSRGEAAVLDAPSSEVRRQFLGWSMSYLFLGVAVLFLWRSPYGQAVIKQFQLGERGYWRWSLSTEQFLIYVNMILPVWLWVLVVCRVITKRSQSLHGWLTLSTAASFLWWMGFNLFLTYTTDPRILYAICPFVVTAALIIVCCDRRWTAVATGLAGIFFAMGIGQAYGRIQFPRFARTLLSVAPLSFQQTPVTEEVGLLRVAKDLQSELHGVPGSQRGAEVMTVVQDAFIEPMGLELAMREINHDTWSDVAILPAPFTSSNFDLTSIFNVRWFLTKEKEKALPLPGDIWTSLYALDSLITDLHSPLHPFFEIRFRDVVKQPGLQDTVTLWHLKEMPPAQSLLEAMLWVKPQFQGTPGASAHERRIRWLDRAVVQGTSVDMIDSTTAQGIINSSDVAFHGIRFGDQFLLRGMHLERLPEGVQMELVWEGLKDEKLEFINFVHVLDSSGKIISQADYPQDVLHAEIKKGLMWRDRVKLSTQQLAGARHIGLGICLPPDPPLRIDHGPTDLDGHRLLIGLR